jgi:hypothetical protein
MAHTFWTWPHRLMTVSSPVSVLNVTTTRPAVTINSQWWVDEQRATRQETGWWRRPECVRWPETPLWLGRHMNY